MNPRRIIFTAYAAILGVFGVAAGAVFVDARAQYKQLKQIELVNRQKLAEAEARLREQERILERLKSDPEYVERALRLRWQAKPDDVIFRFPE